MSVRQNAACPLPEPGAPPGCGSNPLARYLWLLRILARAGTRLVSRLHHVHRAAPHDEGS